MPNKTRINIKNKILVLLIIIIILIILGAIILFSKYAQQKDNQITGNTENIPKEPYVSRIIDGDTFEMSSGEIIRLLCINAPEKGEKGYEESTEFLELLILNKEVKLESDISNKDVYGRLLRYVFLNETFINKEMVKSGNAKVFRYGNDTKRCEEIENS